MIVSIEIIITGLYAIILIINLLTDNSIVNKQQHYESENNFIRDEDMNNRNKNKKNIVKIV